MEGSERGSDDDDEVGCHGEGGAEEDGVEEEEGEEGGDDDDDAGDRGPTGEVGDSTSNLQAQRVAQKLPYVCLCPLHARAAPG